MAVDDRFCDAGMFGQAAEGECVRAFRSHQRPRHLHELVVSVGPRQSRACHRTPPCAIYE